MKSTVIIIWAPRHTNIMSLMPQDGSSKARPPKQSECSACGRLHGVAGLRGSEVACGACVHGRVGGCVPRGVVFCFREVRM